MWGCFFLLFSAKWVGYLRALTCSNHSPKFAGNSKVGEIYVFWSTLKLEWQNGSTEKLIHRCIMFRTDKRVSWSMHEKRNRKAAILHLVCHFGHFPHFYFDKLVSGLSSDQLHIEMNVISTRWRYKTWIVFLSHGVTVAWRQSLITRHQNTRLCISDIHGPIESKLDM